MAFTTVRLQQGLTTKGLDIQSSVAILGAAASAADRYVSLQCETAMDEGACLRVTRATDEEALLYLEYVAAKPARPGPAASFLEARNVDVRLHRVSINGFGAPAFPDGPSLLGGCLRIMQSSLTVTHSRFEHCTALEGGAVFVEAGAIMLNDTEIYACSAVVKGAGVAVTTTTTAIHRVYMHHNLIAPQEGRSSLTEGTRVGGALSCFGSPDVYVADSTIDSNTVGVRTPPASCDATWSAQYVGGGVGSLYCDLTLHNVQLRDNAAGQGGGAYVAEGSANFSFVHMSSNSAIGGGGGVQFYHTRNVTIHGGVISHNTAELSFGGGIDISGPFAPVTMTNTLIDANK